MSPIYYELKDHRRVKFNLRASYPELGLELAAAVHDTLLTCEYSPKPGQFRETWLFSSLWTGRRNDHFIGAYNPAFANPLFKLTAFQHCEVDDAMLDFRVASLMHADGLDLARAITDILHGVGYQSTHLTIESPAAVSMFAIGSGFEPLMIR